MPHARMCVYMYRLFALVHGDWFKSGVTLFPSLLCPDCSIRGAWARERHWECEREEGQTRREGGREREKRQSAVRRQDGESDREIESEK